MTVESLGQKNDVTYVRFAENATNDIDAHHFIQAWLDNEWIVAADVIPHPEFDDFSGFPDTFDVGLAILSERVYVPRSWKRKTGGSVSDLDGRRFRYNKENLLNGDFVVQGGTMQH